MIKHPTSSWRFPLVSIYIYNRTIFHIWNNCLLTLATLFQSGLYSCQNIVMSTPDFLWFLWMTRGKIKENVTCPFWILLVWLSCRCFSECCCVFLFVNSRGGTHCTLDREQSFIRRWPQSSHLSQRTVLELLEQVSLLFVCSPPFILFSYAYLILIKHIILLLLFSQFGLWSKKEKL